MGFYLNFLPLLKLLCLFGNIVVHRGWHSIINISFDFFLDYLIIRYMSVVMLYLLQHTYTHTQFSLANFNSNRPRDEISLVNIDIVNTVTIV